MFFDNEHIREEKKEYRLLLRKEIRKGNLNSEELKSIIFSITTEYYNNAKILEKSHDPLKKCFALLNYARAMFWTYKIKEKHRNPGQLIAQAMFFFKFRMYFLEKKYSLLAISHPDISDDNKAIAYSLILLNPKIKDEEKIKHHIDACKLLSNGVIKIVLKIKLLKRMAIYEKSIGNPNSYKSIRSAINLAKKYGYKEEIKGLLQAI